MVHLPSIFLAVLEMERLSTSDDVSCFDVHIVYQGSILQDATLVGYVNIKATYVAVID